MLPPTRSSFSKRTASPLAIQLINSARKMLQHEQQRMKMGGKEDGDKLVAQLTGEIIFEKY